MIQAVNELKDTKADLQKQIKEKDERMNSMKQVHDEEVQQIRQ
jgi:TolA-binding protein